MTTIPLQPVDSVTVTTLVDNFSDMLLQDQGPAKRPRLGDQAAPQVPAAFLEGGATFDALRAEHGSPS
jgi:7,8-dihydropterin-6-yl-methyl-4-(beta-D-ribofuranosyl)aminobenzene 5'-phosphate synthase